MAMNNPYQMYKKVQIETANPLELVIKLYDGAIRFVNQAKKGLEEHDYQLANNSLVRAQDIIEELNMSLNMETGEIAANLRNIYNFISDELVQANVHKNSKKLEDVVRLLTTLRSAWAEIQIPKKQAVSE
ncbi:MAG TPA: flagellar export chaperone FliS [Bacillota bacterium]|jgi:flagellar protein FliS|nr:flagellar export chaperone FliS [Bacillota bacterium]HOL10515.1 flagellar export chaperone FliS [Bacillota bacterium]HPO97842.1 flagellar export chaperone FliS [Bacillota bacterium]